MKHLYIVPYFCVQVNFVWFFNGGWKEFTAIFMDIIVLFYFILNKGK